MKRLEPWEIQDGGSSQQTASSRPKQRILYVEDEDSNWEVTLLRMRNRFDLIRARNAEEACEVVRAQLPTLAAILMDIQLQGSALNGVQLTQLFRGKLPAAEMKPFTRDVPKVTIPIIYVTANTDQYGEAALLESGANFAIPKPADFVRLAVGLNELILAQRISH